MQDRHIEQPKLLWLKIALPLVVLVLGLLGTWALIRHKTEADEAKVKKTAHEPPLVTVVTARREAQRINIQSQGVVQPKIEIELVPEVSGKVVKTHPNFAPGGFVKQGELLIQIDPRDYEFAVTRAHAAVAEAYKEYARETEEAQQAKEEWQALGQGKASDYLLHKPQLKEREAKLAAAMTDLAAARLQLQRCRLIAPFDGWVRDKRVLPGQYLNTGEKIARLYADGSAEIRLPLTPADMPFIQTPSPNAPFNLQPEVRFTAHFGDVKQGWRGRLVRTASDLDDKNALVYVVAEIPDAFKIQAGKIPLMPGAFLHAELNGIERFDLLSLPKSALFGGNQVYSVDAAGQLKAHKIALLRNDKDRIIVTEGITDGDRIMTGGIDLPVADMRVKIADPKPTVIDSAQ